MQKANSLFRVAPDILRHIMNVLNAFGPVAVLAACRNGKELIVPRSSSLPANCVKCSAAADTPLRKTFYWHPTWIYVLLFSPIIYVIVVMIVRKKIALNLPLCAEHHAERKRNQIIGWVLLLLSIPAGFFLAGVLSITPGRSAIASTLMLVVGVIFIKVADNVLRPRLIDEDQAIFIGADESFLQLLPSQTGY